MLRITATAESNMSKSFVLIVSVLLLAIASAFAAQAQDKVARRTHRVVEITPPNGINGNEVSIAINPTNENNIVAVAMLREFQTDKEKNVAFYPAPDAAGSMFRDLKHVQQLCFLFDGRWQVLETSVCPNPHGRTQGDDAIRFNAEGIAIRSYISFLGIFSPRPSDGNCDHG
jgi:hypothetical protein